MNSVMKKQVTMSVIFLMMLILVGCQLEDTSTEDKITDVTESWTDNTGVVGESVAEDELYEMTWLRILEKAAFDFGHEYLSYSMCDRVAEIYIPSLQDIGENDIIVDVFSCKDTYNRTFVHTTEGIEWEENQYSWDWTPISTVNYNADEHKQISENAKFAVTVQSDGDVTASKMLEYGTPYHEQYVKLGMQMMGVALKVWGENYLEDNGSFLGEQVIEFYMEECNFALNDPKGIVWVLQGEQAKKIVISKGKVNENGVDESLSTEESEGVFLEEIKNNALIALTVKINTTDQQIDWRETAWAKFDQMNEAEYLNEICFVDGFMDNIYYYNQERFPVFDYDGDGLLDRVYQRNEPEGSRHYLFFSNGEILEMTDTVVEPENTKMVPLDIHGDGQAEILYYRLTDVYYGEATIEIWEKGNDGWQQKQPSTFELPMEWEMIEELRAQFTQPDSGLSDEVVLSADEIEHDEMWSLADNEKGQSIVDARDVIVISDEATGKSRLRFSASLHKTYNDRCVTWEMEYLGGTWMISDYSVDPFRTMQGILSAWSWDEEKNSDLLLDERFHKLFGSAKLEKAYLSMSNTGELFCSSGESGKGYNGYYRGYSVIPKNDDLFSVVVTLYPKYIEVGMPKEIRLYTVIEGDSRYLVMEYDNEKLYFTRPRFEDERIGDIWWE